MVDFDKGDDQIKPGFSINLRERKKKYARKKYLNSTGGIRRKIGRLTKKSVNKNNEQYILSRSYIDGNRSYQVIQCCIQRFFFQLPSRESL